MSALRCYFTFAQEQLAAAVRHEVAGSMALHALGKLHAAYARHKTIRVGAAEPKAMTFYQAALLVFPRNHMAANDLGVLLAQAGVVARGAGRVRAQPVDPSPIGRLAQLGRRLPTTRPARVGPPGSLAGRCRARAEAGARRRRLACRAAVDPLGRSAVVCPSDGRCPRRAASPSECAAAPVDRRPARQPRRGCAAAPPAARRTAWESQPTRN